MAVAGGLGLAGFWLLFTGFKPYDDEGYVLISLANFARGGRLYTDIFSQYGPFFYWWNDALQHLLRFDFTNTTGRIFTLGYWLGAAALCAWIVDRQTRAAGWALLALAATFAHLWQMTAEPMHPGGLIAFVVALAAWAGSECITHRRPRGLALVIGLCGAALVLTKINVGVFLFAGAGAWLALHADDGFPAVARKLVAVALVALPWLLMRPLLPEPWVVTFATLVSTAALATLVAASPAARPFFRWSDWLWLVASAALFALATCGLTLARGTGLGALLEGVLLGPLHHPGVFSFAIEWRPGALAWAIGSCAACIATHALGWNTRPAFVRIVSMARIGLLAAAVLGWFAELPLSALAFCVSYGLPAVWLLVIPLARDDAALEHARTRSWLGLLLLTQTLHAFPVGGSQIGWGTFLWAPLLVLAAAEAVAVPAVRWLRPVTTAAAIVAAFGLAFAFGHEGWRRWSTSEPLRLPGAEALRLPEPFSAELRTVALNASVHAGQLFSLPGMFSFNPWSGRPAPTRQNVTHWFSLLNDEQQHEIIRQLDADPRALLVIERSLVQFMRANGILVAGPLDDYLRSDFARAFGVGGYEIWCKRGRTIAPLATARLYERQDQPGTFQLEVCVLTAPGSRVARIDWIDYTHDPAPQPRLSLDASNSSLQVASLRSDGTAFASPAEAKYPAELPRLARIEIITRQPLDRLSQARAVLRLRNAAGAEIAEAVFSD